MIVQMAEGGGAQIKEPGNREEVRGDEIIFFFHILSDVSQFHLVVAIKFPND